MKILVTKKRPLVLADGRSCTPDVGEHNITDQMVIDAILKAKVGKKVVKKAAASAAKQQAQTKET